MKEKLIATIKIATAGLISGIASAFVIGLVIKLLWKAFHFGFNLI